jgi:hypothetical protein
MVGRVNKECIRRYVDFCNNESIFMTNSSWTTRQRQHKLLVRAMSLAIWKKAKKHSYFPPCTIVRQTMFLNSFLCHFECRLSLKFESCLEHTVWIFQSWKTVETRATMDSFISSKRGTVYAPKTKNKN